MVGTADSIVFREVSLIQVSLIERFHCIHFGKFKPSHIHSLAAALLTQDRSFFAFEFLRLAMRKKCFRILHPAESNN